MLMVGDNVKTKDTYNEKWGRTIEGVVVSLSKFIDEDGKIKVPFIKIECTHTSGANCNPALVGCSITMVPHVLELNPRVQ